MRFMRWACSFVEALSSLLGPYTLCLITCSNALHAAASALCVRSKKEIPSIWTLLCCTEWVCVSDALQFARCSKQEMRRKVHTRSAATEGVFLL